MAPLAVAVGCEALLISSCLFGIHKSIKYKPKNYFGFVLLFASIAVAAVLGIGNYASLHPSLITIHPIVSGYVTNSILPLLLPFSVYQALDCGPVRMSKNVGQVVLGVLISLIAFLIYNPKFITTQLGVEGEVIVIGSVVLCVVFSIYGLVAGYSRYRCKNMILCVLTMLLADTILSKNLLGTLNIKTDPFGSVDVFHIIFALAMVFLGNVSGGATF